MRLVADLELFGAKEESKRMAGLNHDFLLVSLNDHGYFDYSQLINKRGAVHIHDDLLRYMSDTLTWIPTYSLGKKELFQSQGFNYYGPTIIKSDGTPKAQQVFESWASIFSCGPEEIKLTGSFVVERPPEINEDGVTALAIDDASYQPFSVNQKQILHRLKRLVNFCQKVITKPELLYILHIGI